jgi:hypothetical protein
VRLGSRLALCAFLAAALPAPARSIAIQFDYTYDTQGFFDPAVNPSAAQARAALEAAGAVYGRLADGLSAIAPGGGDHWFTGFLAPGGGNVVVSDLAVPEDTMVVFVGGRPLFGVLGFAQNGSVLAPTGSAAFLDALAARGQAGALAAIPTDYGPWGGSITFSASAPWHFDPATAPSAGTSDFFTTAVHELAHLLGIGNASSWDALVTDDGDPSTPLLFHGPASVAAYGGPVPLDPNGGHWAEAVASFVNGVPQETLMDPTTARGIRELLTDLDLVGLADIGWEVTPVPEPGTSATLALGLALLAARRRLLGARRIVCDSGCPARRHPWASTTSRSP